VSIILRLPNRDQDIGASKIKKLGEFNNSRKLHPGHGYGARSASASAPGVGGNPHARGFLRGAPHSEPHGKTARRKAGESRRAVAGMLSWIEPAKPTREHPRGSDLDQSADSPL